MPEYTLRRNDANDRYYIHWSDGRRSKRRSTGTSDLAEAQAVLAHFILMERTEPAVVTTATVADLWKAYRAKHVNRTASIETAEMSWKNMEPHFGGKILAEVTQDLVEKYEALRRGGRIGRPSKPATVRRELATLRACLNWCASPKRRIVMPAEVPVFDLPADSDPRQRWLTRDELKRLFAAARRLRRGPRMSRGERFLWIALETAARKQAILDLTWDRIDFDAGVIHFEVPGRQRTKKRRADVAMSTALRPVLLRARDEAVGPLVLDNKAPVWATVQTIAIEAGMGGGQPKPARSKKPRSTGISPHVLRHTAATHMARGGVPLWQIANVLGNTLAVVEKTYAKWAPDDPAGTVDRISAGVLELAE